MFLVIIIIALNNAAFTPHIIIPGVPTTGDNFNIVCRLDGVIERLAVTPGLVILTYSSAPGGLSGDILQTGPVRTRLRMFNPGMTDDVGMYSCAATVLISSSIFGFISNGLLQIQSMIVPLFHFGYLHCVVLCQSILPRSLSPSLVPLTPPHCMKALLST